MHRGALALAISVSLTYSAVSAYAAVTISSGATQNMSCSNGVCAPTATRAVLNSGDLETLLASGNVSVVTAGQGLQAKDIDVKAPVTWSSSSVLTLDAYRSVTIDQPVSITGLAGLALDTSDGNKGKSGTLTFGKNGNVTFANMSSSLSINGAAYTLVDTISSLARAIRSDRFGRYAFGQSYNAKEDGTYRKPPIAITFRGVFEGLGNTISNLTISDAADDAVGFFKHIQGGYVHDIGFDKAKVSSGASSVVLGVLAGSVFAAHASGNTYSGVITGSWASGSVSDTSSTFAQVGGLVGYACNYGSGYQPNAVIGSHTAVTISGGQGIAGGLVGHSCGVVESSYATGAITAGTCSWVSGLVGGSEGDVENSFATGSATTGNSGDCDPPPSAGGLVGNNFGINSSPGTIENSYSTGVAVGGSGTNVGGMVGLSFGGTISDSYSTGAPSAGSGSYVGGFVGDDEADSLTDTYWDTTTSGITNLSQGAGNISNASGITGLTTQQFQSGLPAGFDPKVWAEKFNINGGLPYLLANPPPK